MESKRISRRPNEASFRELRSILNDHVDQVKTEKRAICRTTVPFARFFARLRLQLLTNFDE